MDNEVIDNKHENSQSSNFKRNVIIISIVILVIIVGGYALISNQSTSKLDIAGSTESGDASVRDYERRGDVSYIKSVISNLYSGRNSFPVSESQVHLDDFENPIVTNLISVLIESRKNSTGETIEEAEDFWRDQLRDPQPEKYHYIYQSFDNGDSFSITYIQESPNRAILGDYIEQCTNKEGVCQIKEVVTGKYIRDEIRRFRINEIVPDLSVLMTAGSLKSFPILTNTKFGTSENKEVEDLLKTSGLLPKFDNSNSIWQPKSFDDLIRDPDYPSNHYLYSSNGTVFSVKVKLENTPDENNGENLLKNFCEPSGTIFKRYCSQENGVWYLVQENTRK